MNTAQFNNLSRRVGTQWALAAAQSEGNGPSVVPPPGYGVSPRGAPVLATAPSRAYKPAHGGYPG